MKFVVAASAIAAALGVASKITDRRNTIPILSNVLLQTVGDRVLIKSTDSDLEISLPVEAKIERPGSISLPALLLFDIMRKAPAGSEATFDLKDNASLMSVRAARSNFQIQTLPAVDFPEMSGANYSNTIELAGDVLHRLLSSVQFAISTEETRYYLNGIYLHTKDGDQPVIRAVATDGHRLARIEMDRPAGAADMPAIIIPRKAVAEIILLTAGVTEPVSLEVSNTKIRVTVGDIVLISKLIDGTYPDYERVIPQVSNTLATVNAKQLSIAADRVATISNEKGRAVKFLLVPGSLTLTVNNPDAGSATDVIEVDYDADPIEIGFNSKYLTAALGALPGGVAKLSLTDASSPARFTADGDDSLLIVLMPMRV